MAKRKFNYFIDTSAFIALLDKRDQNHKNMLGFLNVDNEFSGITSNLVLAELLTYFSGEHQLEEVIAFQESFLKDDNSKIVWIDEKAHNDAIPVMKKFKEHFLSFVDATSMSIMKKEKLTHALSFDSDFVKAGFVILP